MAEKAAQAALRKIPKMDLVLSRSWIAFLESQYNKPFIVAIVRRALDELRSDILSGKADERDCELEQVDSRIRKLIETRLKPSLKALINATGVIIHTNLGRAPLPEAVIDRISNVARSYSNLEYDLEKGSRGERNSHLRALMEELTGAESALAVNNNAAAVLLALSSLAEGKEVIVSRGELIEIGGSFRIPDVMARSNCILREVGTTNRTHPKDYEQAINENTALLLKVHTSNYRIIGFTKEVGLEELADLGKKHGIPTMFDLGSGCLVDLSEFGLVGEPTVREVISSGIDVVTLSGDKLLGGPQAGIIAGKSVLLEKMRSNQLTRALRMDKMTLAGLEGALEEYLRAEGPFAAIPTLSMISKPYEIIVKEAEALARAIEASVGPKAHVTLEEGEGRVGGGSLPMAPLRSMRVKVKPELIGSAELERRLRKTNPPLIVLVHDDATLLDPRTLLHDQVKLIPDIIAKCLENKPG